MQGLIIENISNLYKIKTEKGIYEANARGKFKKEEITPVVGDKVEIQILDEENKKAVIEEIQQRTTYIKRPKMSNITQLVLVVSSKNPKPDLLLLDKQLAFAEYLGIKPIIVLNKIDLDKKKEFEKIKETYQNIGYTVIETIAKELENAKDISSKNITSSTGIQELEKKLKGNINAFSGNSGVGKSTLINAIFNDTITQEGEISQRNKKGKNTTTSTKLYEIDENTYIADTPGFSTFDISEIEYRKLDQYFKEFKPLLENCEFVGCTHIKEQNCGIKKALEKGKIDSGRYERFCKIYEELKEKERYKW
ncbi:MAG: ribosome small subunit-dependent GTPase A [Clostridia bacterium]